MFEVRSFGLGGAIIVVHAQTSFTSASGATSMAVSVHYDDVAKIVDQWNKGYKVGAIKQFRQLSCWNLKESKDVCEHLAAKY